MKRYTSNGLALYVDPKIPWEPSSFYRCGVVEGPLSLWRGVGFWYLQVSYVTGACELNSGTLSIFLEWGVGVGPVSLSGLNEMTALCYIQPSVWPWLCFKKLIEILVFLPSSLLLFLSLPCPVPVPPSDVSLSRTTPEDLSRPFEKETTSSKDSFPYGLIPYFLPGLYKMHCQTVLSLSALWVFVCLFVWTA